ncbi:MAG: hypothetical protein PHS92_03730 [Candidatus Gracilibacteria bacterium]|nr:hypothetical protein [Candidatus Gracilibacteria bacterium]
MTTENEKEYKNTDPDFKTGGSDIIDIRPLLSDKWYLEDQEYGERERGEPLIPKVIVSQSRKIEIKNRKILARRKKIKALIIKLKYGVFRVFLFIYRKILILFIGVYQKLENKIRSLEWGGINFDVKYDEKTLYFLAVSLPQTVYNVEQILMYYPILSKKNCYKLLEIRRNELKKFNEIFNKRNTMCQK